MDNHPQAPGRPEEAEFIEQAKQSRPGVFAEYWDFLRYNKKWWITPIMILLLLIGFIIILGGTAAAPFIYALF